MFDSGEILVIAVVAFLVFGPKRLPELARTLGKIVGEIREGMRNATVEMKKEFEEIEKTEKEPETESPQEEDHSGKEAADPGKPEPPR
jgi:sec-independent protein translocase protein TatB